MRYPIGEMAQIIDGDRGKNYPKQHEFFDSGYCLFLNTGNVTRSGFSFEHNQFITQEKCDALRKGKLQRGDIVYTTRGTVGNAALYSMAVPYDHIRINSGMVIIRPDEAIVYTEFLYHILKSSYYRPFFKQYCTGSAQPQLPIKNFSKIVLDIPELPVQKQIAGILSTYDDLIENSRRQIKLLEEAAQRLYKEWFVDLRFPGHENTPIVDGVPKGWKVGNIQDISTCYDNKRIPLSSKQRDAQKKIYPYYGAASLMDYVENYIFDGTYLLFGEDGTVVTSDGAPKLQYVWGKIWVNNHAHVFQGKGKYTTEFLYMLCKNMKVSDVMTGVAQPKISQGRLNAKPILIPSEKLVVQYIALINGIFGKIRVLSDLMKEAQESRDRLLPKLARG